MFIRLIQHVKCSDIHLFITLRHVSAVNNLTNRVKLFKYFIWYIFYYWVRYKPEGRGFDSRWCHWNFSLT